jgi:hypothetical protein
MSAVNFGVTFSDLSGLPILVHPFSLLFGEPPTQLSGLPVPVHPFGLPVSVHPFSLPFGEPFTQPSILPFGQLSVEPSVTTSSHPVPKKKTKRTICKPHGKQIHLCAICGGSSLCKCGKQKNQCRKCGGKGFCQHNRLRWQCFQCGGASMCHHGIRKTRCKDCGGSDFCVHRKLKYNCRICKPLRASEKQAATILVAGFAGGDESPRTVALVRSVCSECVTQTNQ